MKKVIILTSMFAMLLFSCSKESEETNENTKIKMVEENVNNPVLKSLEGDPTANYLMTQGENIDPDRASIGIWLHLWDRSGIRGRSSSFCRYAGFCGGAVQPFEGNYYDALELGLLEGRDIVVFLSEEIIEQGYLELFYTSEINPEISDFDMAFINPTDLKIAEFGYYFEKGIYPLDNKIGEYGGYRITIK